MPGKPEYETKDVWAKISLNAYNKLLCQTQKKTNLMPEIQNWEASIFYFTPFEPDLDLLLLWFETEDFSFVCFFVVPVTTSNIVGRSFIIVKRRFLCQKWHLQVNGNFFNYSSEIPSNITKIVHINLLSATTLTPIGDVKNNNHLTNHFFFLSVTNYNPLAPHCYSAPQDLCSK